MSFQSEWEWVWSMIHSGWTFKIDLFKKWNTLAVICSYVPVFLWNTTLIIIWRGPKKKTTKTTGGCFRGSNRAPGVPFHGLPRFLHFGVVFWPFFCLGHFGTSNFSWFWGPKDVNALAWVIRDLELLKMAGTRKTTTPKKCWFRGGLVRHVLQTGEKGS